MYATYLKVAGGHMKAFTRVLHRHTDDELMHEARPPSAVSPIPSVPVFTPRRDGGIAAVIRGRRRFRLVGCSDAGTCVCVCVFVLLQIPTSRFDPVHINCDEYCSFPVADRAPALVEWMRTDDAKQCTHILLVGALAADVTSQWPWWPGRAHARRRLVNPWQ